MVKKIFNWLFAKWRRVWRKIVEQKLFNFLFFWILLINILFYDSLFRVAEFIFPDAVGFSRFYNPVWKFVRIINFPYFLTFGRIGMSLGFLSGSEDTIAIVKESSVAAFLSGLVFLAGRRIILFIIARIRR